MLAMDQFKDIARLRPLRVAPARRHRRGDRRLAGGRLRRDAGRSHRPASWDRARVRAETACDPRASRRALRALQPAIAILSADVTWSQHALAARQAVVARVRAVDAAPVVEHRRIQLVPLAVELAVARDAGAGALRQAVERDRQRAVAIALATGRRAPLSSRPPWRRRARACAPRASTSPPSRCRAPRRTPAAGARPAVRRTLRAG